MLGFRSPEIHRITDSFRLKELSVVSCCLWFFFFFFTCGTFFLHTFNSTYYFCLSFSLNRREKMSSVGKYVVQVASFYSMWGSEVFPALLQSSCVSPAVPTGDCCMGKHSVFLVDLGYFVLWCHSSESEDENIESLFILKRTNNLLIVITILFFFLSVNSSCCWQLTPKRFQVVVFNLEWEQGRTKLIL